MKRLSAGVVGSVILLAAIIFVSNAKELTIGKQAPSFSLTDSNGKKTNLSDYKGKLVVLEWTNPSCPFVKKHYSTGNMQALQAKYTHQGVVWLAIASSAKGKEGYLSGDEWNKTITEKNISATTVLLDPDGKVGKLYGAKCTPHMFVVNADGSLVYQGAIDDKASVDAEDVKTAKNYVAAAIDETRAGKSVSVPSTTPYGCSVKYK